MRLIYTCSWLLGLVLLPYVRSSAEELPKIEAIKEAWDKRSQDLKSCQLIWTEVRTSSEQELAGLIDRKLKPDGLRTTSYKKAIISGDRFRLSSQSRIPNIEDETSSPYEFTAVFDRAGRTLVDNPGTQQLTGTINLAAADFSDVTFRAPFLGLNPANPDLGQIELRDYRILPKLEKINGRNCVVLELEQEVRGESPLYLDLERQFVVVRAVILANKKVQYTTDINYDRTSTGVWYPETWKIELLANDRRSFGARYEARSKRFQAPYSSSDQDFKLEFPPNTIVRDASAPLGKSAR